jgi:hypothetical protein
MAKRKVADGDIPGFLLVKNRGKVKAKRAKTPTTAAAAVVQPTLLEQIEDVDFREYVAGEIKAGRIQGKWLADGTTTEMLRHRFYGKRAEKEAGLAKLAEYKAAHPRPVRQKPVYPEDALHVVHHDTANPRKVGSSNHAKYESFKAYMANHPRATVGEVLANTKYYRNDLMWDVKQGRIKLAKK